jgi:hypothetical protein
MEEPHPGDHPTAAGDPTTAAGDPPTAASLGQDERAGQAHTPVDLGLATAAAQRTTSAGQGLDMAAAPEVQAALGMANQGMAALAMSTTTSGLAAPASGLPAPGDSMDAAVAEGLDTLAEAPMSSALALARSLLPTVPHPAVEYNLPVLDVQR